MPESVPQASNFIKKDTLAQVFCCEFSEISKNTFLHRTPLVAASGISSFSRKVTDKKEDERQLESVSLFKQMQQDAIRVNQMIEELCNKMKALSSIFQRKHTYFQ